MINLRQLSVYQKLVWCAVLHSLALFGFGLAVFVANSEWATRPWVAFATLWFFWPVVLLLHSRGSIRRLAIAIALSVALPLPFFGMYDGCARWVFGWPEGFSIMPKAAVNWTIGYLAGQAKAKRDVKNGHLVIEEFGFGAGSGHRVQILRDRYGIELKRIADDVVNSRIFGHEYAYNGISKPEITRRYGPNAIQTAFEEGSKLDR